MRDVIDDQRKTLSELRKKLQSAGFATAEILVPRRGNPVAFPMGKVGWCNGEDLRISADISYQERTTDMLYHISCHRHNRYSTYKKG